MLTKRGYFLGTCPRWTRQAIYVWHYIQVRSWNHYCRVKAKSVIHSECVFVALGTHHAMRRHHIVICGMSDFTFSLMIWYMIWYDMLWYDMIRHDIWYDIYDMLYDMMIYDMIYIYILTAIGLPPGGSTHLHTNNTQNNSRHKTISRTTQFTD